MKLPSIRTIDFLAFLLCAGLLGTAFYFELVMKLEPCPLCIVQRLVFILLAILFLISSLINFERITRLYYHLFISLMAGFGIFTAARQVWIEHLPPGQVPSCGASLHYLFQILPFTQALQVVFQGSGSCAKVTWRFLGLSMPTWALMFFIVLAGIGIWQAFRSSSFKTQK